MKKLFLILTCASLSFEASAPAGELKPFTKDDLEMLIEAEKEKAEILRLEPLIRAIVQVESSSGQNLYNKKENAVGWFQIRQVRVDYYNALRGTHYKLEDFYDYELSKEMFIYFARGKSFEQAAKDWNGSGKMTEKYWQKVKEILKREESKI